jgi:hypothetical protein
MYYELESRRLKNHIAEHVVYGWAEDNVGMANVQRNEETLLEQNFDCPF